MEIREKIFYHVEFTNFNSDGTMISIGLVSEDNRTFYGECSDYDMNNIDPFIMDTVVKNLKFKKAPIGQDECYMMSRHKNSIKGTSIEKCCSIEMRGTEELIITELIRWLNQFSSIVLWSDFVKTSFKLPSIMAIIPFDLRTLFEIKGINPDIDRGSFVSMSDNKNKYDSLYYAKIIKRCYKKLI